MTQVTPNATPKRLKKRNLGKLATAGVATFAGLALAATAFNVTQSGSAAFQPSYDPPTVAIDESNYSVTSMDLGTLETSKPSEPSTTFSIVNESDERGEARVLGVQNSNGDSGLYSGIQIQVLRLDPRNGSAEPEEMYLGSLSAFRNVYMGDVVARGTQDFVVYAWVPDGLESDTENPDIVTTAFSVEYGVFGYTEDEPADQIRDEFEAFANQG